MTQDLTKGKPIKLVLLFALPMLIGNVFQQFYSMVDMIVVGKYINADALAAVGATGGITFFVLGFIFGLSNGFSVVIAQKFGSNDEEGVKKTTAMIIILAIIIGSIVTLLSVTNAKNILELMKTPDNIIEQSYAYLVVIFAGTLCTMAYNTTSAILRALGDSKTPLYFLVVASILNIVLDVVFVANFKMGVEGTAYATIISQGVSFVLCFLYIRKRYPILRIKKEHFALDPVLIKKMLSMGIPGAMSNSITALGVMVLQSTINGFGSTVVAAYTAGVKVEQFFTMPCMTLGMAMATFAGQNIGAGRLDRVKTCLNDAIKVSVAYSVIGGMILYFFGSTITTLFVNASEVDVISNARIYLNIIGFFCWVLGLLFLYRSTIQGLGNGYVPMISGAIELIMRTTAALILSKIFGFTGVCFASAIAWIGADIFLIPFYYHQVKGLEKKRLNEKNEDLELVLEQ